MSHNITVEGGTSVRLPTAGKYCDRDIVITAEGGTSTPVIKALTVAENGTYTAPDGVAGYSPVTVSVAPPPSDIDALIDGSITEVESNAGLVIEYSFRSRTALTTANFPVATEVGSYAFYNCTALTTANFPVATRVGSNAFYGCTVLKTANFPAATSVGDIAFSDCKALTTANFPVATKVGYSAFSGCKALTTANFPVATSVEDSAFSGCKALTTVDFPVATSVGGTAFNGCTALTTANFPVATSIGSNAFYKAYSLVSLILRGNTVASLQKVNAFASCYHFHGTVNSTYNPDGLKDGYIYVPAALVEEYKSATNWSAFASQFRALEDYTVDGTTTGELDPTKI